MSATRRIALWAWATVLLGSLLWPLAAPGELLFRDMSVVDNPALSLNALGFGDLPSRNAPQDGVLALFGFLPVSWLVRAMLLVAGLAGAWGAMQLGRAQFAAVTVAIYNPFVIERLLQGHWSLVIAVWLLPLIVALRAHPRAQILAIWAASITPTGAVVAAIVGVTVSRRKSVTTLFSILSFLPWLVPSLLSAPTSGGALTFAIRAETYASTLGTALGLGGIWNAGAVPQSRELGFAVAGILLFIILLAGFRNCPWPLGVLALAGLVGAIGPWLLPELFTWMIAYIPGTALFRDSHKLLMFVIPAYVCLAAGLKNPFSWIATVLALLQIPDAPREVAVMSPSSAHVAEVSALAERAAGRDVLIVGSNSLVSRDDGIPVVDPRTKALSVVESGELRVDGIITDAPSNRWTQAMGAWHAGDLDRLAQLGVGMVVDGDTIVETTAPPQRGWKFYLGLSLTVLWLMLPLGLLIRSSKITSRKFKK
ncbi:hypothetical protein CDES_12840 [Corynebacterium deserti GIMN1.010]|uniref:Transmembrane protein n=1 Tax=Corynebacterium deserti GIMN1.010 TaxID=931089 RepID=A0A0M4CZC3_9CORY|nr:hypothetical protein [Corynebacterium deserti]ALC06912.1 hypothetical protein CDES_12840 [Corynebacterium deserti GIMN1.010]